MASAVRGASGPKALFILSSTLSRGLWAFYTIYLATVLGQSVYGEFIFLQITAAFVGQILVGSLLNINAFNMAAALDFSAALKIYVRTNLYIITLCVAAVPVLLILQAVHILPGGYLAALAIAALTAATALGGQAIAFACSQGAYRAAAALSVTSFLLYVSVCSVLQSPNAVLITAAVSIAQAAPFMISLLWILGRGQASFAILKEKGALHALVMVHRDALATNISSVPQQMLIWVMARNLMSYGGAVEFSRYGIANQLNNLFLFFPTSFAPMFIAWIGKNGGLSNRIKISCGMACVFSGLGLLSAVGVVMAMKLFPAYIPQEFMEALAPMAIALVMAGLVAARSPFAWINQINRDYRSEWIISLVTSACMLASLAPSYGGSSEGLLYVRVGAALIGLSVSAALLLMSARRRGLEV